MNNSALASISDVKLDDANISLSMLADIDFDDFEPLAAALCQAMDLRVLEKQWGADRHQWLVEFEGSRLWLNFELYGRCCWLNSENADDVEVLSYLQSLLEAQL
ncbi:hypothetical protein HR45_14105 [Shewanella mangrovi]|uniref:Aminopeptidase n=1 Tax=Shewanella mangrovi TaxID=1515746 RepID=A0A094JBY8_9GAMM|nr:DUF3630 family protein [Shewanella mangrovi]KFZ36752.1 hypothetical protein HR45_14105 [Shewanella mangrovi]